MSGREKALSLIKEREALEKEIENIRDEMNAISVGPDEPLVTPDGFPRHDIDVATARRLRVELIRKENDLKSLLEEISVSLRSAFPPKSSASAETKTPPRPKTFAIVKSVLSGSLGDEAGLQADDEIVKFGGTRSFTEISQVFKSSIGGTLIVEVYRPQQGKVHSAEINVTPGRSLGCHLVPK